MMWRCLCLQELLKLLLQQLLEQALLGLLCKRSLQESRSLLARGLPGWTRLMLAAHT
jgi:hypothetical protein